MKIPSLLRSWHFVSGMAPHWFVGAHRLVMTTMNDLMTPSLLLILALLLHLMSMMALGHSSEERNLHVRDRNERTDRP